MKRVNKAIARKLFNEGKEVWITPCLMCPEYGILLNAPIYLYLGKDFDNVVNMFEYYCCNKETGRYSAFYIAE